ncbi:MAG: FecR domain-containing protein, partial [Proteobacteria bacterium]|nr:FecR domain-containing protein [Pseudomonadota bacterium]
GAATIAFHLQQRHGRAPAVSTIWRVLSARGFVTPQPHKRPYSSYVRFSAEQPNERWQLDITHRTLADGTEVLLDTDSSVTARFSDRARRIELQRGRAQFVVAADTRRPFTVEAGAATIRDIGTTFQVGRRGDAVEVGLLEGALIVIAASRSGASRRSTLAPGQQVTVDAAGNMQARRALDLAVAEAWPRGDLVFKNRRLDVLLAEMNRYSEAQLRLADPRLGDTTVSGVFHIHDQPALIAALEQGWSLRAERLDEHQIVLHGPAR